MKAYVYLNFEMPEPLTDEELSKLQEWFRLHSPVWSSFVAVDAEVEGGELFGIADMIKHRVYSSVYNPAGVNFTRLSIEDVNER